MTTRPPAWAYLFLVDPARAQRNLDLIRASGLATAVPNLWQLCLGVARMAHRIAFRSDTIGTSRAQRVRANPRARLLAVRPVRFPFLLAHGSIAPWDLSGLTSSPARLIRHLLGTHHDEHQFVYDLEILRHYPGALDALARRARAVVTRDDRHARWLRDLCVFEGYHEALLAAVEAALRDGVHLPADEADDPDIAFDAYLRWCAQQPPTPSATLAAWRAGRWRLTAPLADPGPERRVA